MNTGIQNTVGQWSSFTVAGIAALLCGGKVMVISLVSALGLGAIIEHAYLMPIFVAFVSLQLWFLHRSARCHGDLRPFYLGLVGGIYGSVSLWLNITALFIQPYQIYLTGAMLLGALIWDAVNGRQQGVGAEVAVVEIGAEPQVEIPEPAADSRATVATQSHPIVHGAAMAVAAAGVFYGIYKSVDALAPSAQAGEIACWGINACKGQTACSTAFNGCPGQNACKGRGFLYVDANQCWKGGGVPLAGSEADPKRRG